MTIVANNSITVSNVNDGTITHTAYAYSADGTDRFTTIYPNLNLLNFNSGVTLGKYYGWRLDVTSWSGNRAYLKKVKVTPNKQYTISANWSNTEWLNVYAFTNESDTTAVARYGSAGGLGVGSWDSSNLAGGYTVSNNMTFTVPTNVNYIGVSYASLSKDTLTLQALLNGKPKLESGSTATPWMPSASESTTADWPSYIGQYSDFTSTASTDPAKYAPWTIFKGADGVGVTSTVITYAISTSGTTAPSAGWTSTVPTVAAGNYLWTKTVWAYTDNTSETGYSVAKMGNNGATGPQGPQGLKGDPGATGIPGQAGADGKTSYLHIAYATNSDGTAGFDTSNATGKTYIGQYTDFTSADSTDQSKYTWSLIKGDKGDKGDPGAPGTDGTNGTSGIIVSSVAPASPQNGQLWQDTSTTPKLVKKWTGSEWVIWELYAQNLKADTLSALSSNLGDVSAGTVKLMADVAVNDTLKKHGLYQSKLGLLSSGPSLATPSTFSNSQMGVANLNKGELRFIVTDYTEDLKTVQESGISDQNTAFIRFSSYDNGKDVMLISSSGDIVFNGITSQDTPWIAMGNGTYYKNMFSRVYISYSVTATSTANIPLGVLPVGLRPFRGLHLTANAWGTTLSNDRHIEVRTTGEVTLYNPANGASYDGEVSFTI